MAPGHRSDAAWRAAGSTQHQPLRYGNGLEITGGWHHGHAADSSTLRSADLAKHQEHHMVRDTIALDGHQLWLAAIQHHHMNGGPFGVCQRLRAANSILRWPCSPPPPGPQRALLWSCTHTERRQCVRSADLHQLTTLPATHLQIACLGPLPQGCVSATLAQDLMLAAAFAHAVECTTARYVLGPQAGTKCTPL